MKDDKKLAEWNIIFVLCSLLWFLASVALMIKFAMKHDLWLTLMVFFSLFLWFGLTGLISDKLNRRPLQKIVIPTIIIGICGVILMLILKNSSNAVRVLILKLAAVAFLIAVAAYGARFVFVLIRERVRSRVCTESITAKCVNCSESLIGHRFKVARRTINAWSYYEYIPTYEYEYNGITYTSKAYKTREERSTGESYEILVNSKSPGSVHDPESQKPSIIAIAFVALFCVALPVLAAVGLGYFLFV